MALPHNLFNILGDKQSPSTYSAYSESCVFLRSKSLQILQVFT